MDKQDQAQKFEVGNQSQDKLSELFRFVDSRQKPPEDDRLAIRQAVHAQWSGQLQQKRKKQWNMGLAVAASLLVAIALSVYLIPIEPDPGTAFLAESGRVLGVVQVESAAGDSSKKLDSQQPLAAGETITTGQESGLAIHWSDGAVLRMGENSVLQLQSVDVINLRRGKLFIDTSALQQQMSAPLLVTEQGEIRHIGTTWVTEAGDFGTRLKVRDGKVSFTGHATQDQTLAPTLGGQQLLISTKGEFTSSAINTWGEEWAWAEKLADVFPAEERNMDQLFEWVGHETGRRVVYGSAQARQLARQTLLLGEFSLPPMQALQVATETSDFFVEMVEDQMRIDLDTEKESPAR